VFLNGKGLRPQLKWLHQEIYSMDRIYMDQNYSNNWSNGVQYDYFYLVQTATLPERKGIQVGSLKDPSSLPLSFQIIFFIKFNKYQWKYQWNFYINILQWTLIIEFFIYIFISKHKWILLLVHGKIKNYRRYYSEIKKKTNFF